MSNYRAALQGLSTVLKQMEQGADDELTMQVLVAHTGIDGGQEQPQTPDQADAVALAQSMAGTLARMIDSMLELL